MSDLSRQNGARWESYIRAECKALWSAKRAFVAKNWEAPRVRGEHARWEPSKPDFSGFLPGGRHVVFEAKAILTRSTSFPFARIERHQWEHLDRAYQAGALAFVYLLNGDEKWVIPWGRILAVADTRASFPLLPGDPCIKRLGETWFDRLEAMT